MLRNIQAPFKRLLVRAGITASLLMFAVAASNWLILTFPPYEVLLVFAIGIVLVGWAGANLWRYLRTSDWVPVDANLIEMRERVREVAIGVVRFRYIFPEVSYTYFFDGRPFVGSSASVEAENIWVMDFEREKAAWSQWKPGNTVVAYVNPWRPTQSHLIRDLSASRRSHHAAVLVGGCLIVALGAVLA